MVDCACVRKDEILDWLHRVPRGKCHQFALLPHNLPTKLRYVMDVCVAVEHNPRRRLCNSGARRGRTLEIKWAYGLALNLQEQGARVVIDAGGIVDIWTGLNLQRCNWAC